MGDNITIWDDGLDTGGMPLPFDTEGVPKKRVALITKGVAAGVVYDTSEALKAGTSSTGHAFPYGAFIGGAMPTNAFLKPGPATVDEMIASTDHGLLVTRFHYTRAVDPRRVVITGMTRDGTFLIRDGKIAGAVKNLRFTESYVEAMSRVEAISARTKIQGGRIGAAVVPALKITNFNFTGVTEF
jgi:predicted Zn-dependent protease